MKVDSTGIDIMVALYENGLVTDCPRGENSGRVLANDYVVRKLEKLCTVKDLAAKKTVSETAHFTVWDGFNSAKCGVAVFLQNASLQIFGTQSFQLPDEIWQKSKQKFGTYYICPFEFIHIWFIKSYDLLKCWQVTNIVFPICLT